MQRDDGTERSEFPADPPPVWEAEWEPAVEDPAYPAGFYGVMALLGLAIPLGAVAAYTAGRGSAEYVLLTWEIPLRLMLQCCVPLVVLGTGAPFGLYGLLNHRAWARYWVPGMVLIATIVAFGLFDSTDPIDVVTAVALAVAAPVLVFWYFYGCKRVAGYYRARSQPVAPVSDDVAGALRGDVRSVARAGLAVGAWNCLGGIAAGVAASRVPDGSWLSGLVSPSGMFLWAAVTGLWAISSVALLGARDWGRKGTILSLRATFLAEVAWVVHCLGAVPLEGSPAPTLLMAAVLGGAGLFAVVNVPLFGIIRLLTDDDVREALLSGPGSPGDGA